MLVRDIIDRASVPRRTVVGVCQPYLPYFTLSVPRGIPVMDRHSFNGLNAQPLTLLEPLFLMFSNFSLSVPQRTPIIDSHAFNGPSCTIVATIITLLLMLFKKFTKCSSMDPHDGPSCLRQDVYGSVMQCCDCCTAIQFLFPLYCFFLFHVLLLIDFLCRY